METLIVYISKGGVGKTTLAGLIGQYLAGIGYNVAIADLDRQGSQTKLFQLDEPGRMHHVIRREMAAVDALCPVPPESIPHLSSMPAGQLAVMPGGAHTMLAVDGVLSNPNDFDVLNSLDLFREPFAELNDVLDFLIIDMGPSDQVAAIAALAASDWLLIPTDTEYLSLTRIQSVLAELAVAQRVHDVNVLGIVPTKAVYHFGRLRQSKSLVATWEYLKTHYNDLLLCDDQGPIDLPYDEDWKNAVWLGVSLFSEDVRKPVRVEALRFVSAVAARLGAMEAVYG